MILQGVISMARNGISYLEVAQAATELTGQGRHPTVEQVRLLLGTGSATTITNHLRQWKTQQEEISLLSSKENIPSELLTLVKGLWKRVIDQSQEKFATTEEGYQQTIDRLQQELAKYKVSNRRWQRMHEQWVTQKINLLEQLGNAQAYNKLLLLQLKERIDA